MCHNRSARIYRWLLQVGRINERGRFRTQAIMLHIADHAYDLSWPVFLSGIRIVTQANLFSDGIFVRKIPAHECLVHDYCPRRGIRIVIVEIAPSLERNPQGAENPWADLIISSLRS